MSDVKYYTSYRYILDIVDRGKSSDLTTFVIKYLFIEHPLSWVSQTLSTLVDGNVNYELLSYVPKEITFIHIQTLWNRSILWEKSYYMNHWSTIRGIMAYPFELGCLKPLVINLQNHFDRPKEKKNRGIVTSDNISINIDARCIKVVNHN